MGATEDKPANHWFHIPLQAIGAAFCVYFYFNVPKSGKALLNFNWTALHDGER